MIMISDVIRVQKEELAKRLSEQYVPRDIQTPNVQSGMITVITGPRRAGKSFYSVHILNSLGKFGYVNLDDEQLVDTKNYDDIIKAVDTIYDSPQYLMIDEIQNLDKWELLANRLQRQGYKLLITGSNSNLLSKELATHLTGRHQLAHVPTFSFKEYLSFYGENQTDAEKKARLGEYLVNGGYPEPLIKKLAYREYLNTLLDSIIYKDIVKRFNIRSYTAIGDLVTYLVSNSTKEFSYNTLSTVTQCKSVNTAKKYVGYLEEAFIFFTLERFSFKVKEQKTMNKKIYCTDTGFIHAKAFKIGEDLGKLYENAVGIALKRSEIAGGPKIYFWKNDQQEEVDFVLYEGTKTRQLIQVCYDPTDKKTKEREVRSLLKAAKELKCNNLLIITDNVSKEETVEWFGSKGKIKFVPLWQWLLE